jgi:hypothetical protein
VGHIHYVGLLGKKGHYEKKTNVNEEKTTLSPEMTNYTDKKKLCLNQVIKIYWINFK